MDDPTFKTYIVSAQMMYEVSAPTMADAKATVDAIYDRARGGRPYVVFDDETIANQIYCEVTAGRSERWSPERITNPR